MSEIPNKPKPEYVDQTDDTQERRDGAAEQAALVTPPTPEEVQLPFAEEATAGVEAYLAALGQSDESEQDTSREPAGGIQLLDLSQPPQEELIEEVPNPSLYTGSQVAKAILESSVEAEPIELGETTLNAPKEMPSDEARRQLPVETTAAAETLSSKGESDKSQEPGVEQVSGVKPRGAESETEPQSIVAEGGSGSDPPIEDRPRTGDNGNGEGDDDRDNSDAGETRDQSREMEEIPQIALVRIVVLDFDDLLADVGERIQEHHLTVWREEYQLDNSAVTAGQEEMVEESNEALEASEAYADYRERMKRITGTPPDEVFPRLWPDKSRADHERMLGRFRELVSADLRGEEGAVAANPIPEVVEGLRRLREWRDNLPPEIEKPRFHLLTGRSIGLEEAAVAADVPLDMFERIRAKGGGYEQYTTKAAALEQDVVEAGVLPENVVMVGDAISDMEAGVAAGTQRFGIPRHGATREDLREAGATQVAQNFTVFEHWLVENYRIFALAA